MKAFKIPFGFDEHGNAVDVHNAEKGLIYFCSCGAEIKLRGGEVVSDHFYHINESECSLESSIHKAYKSVLYNVKKLKLPYTVNGTDTLVFDRVDLEKRIDDYVPDAIGYIGETKYLIEFAKTSYIGELKQKKIKKSNLFCVEIDIVKTIQTLLSIEDHLVNCNYYKHIVHIPEYDEMKELRNKFGLEYRSLQSKLDIAQRELIEKTNELNRVKEILGNVCLYYRTDCKNGSKLYKKEFGLGRSIVGFYNSDSITIKFDI